MSPLQHHCEDLVQFISDSLSKYSPYPPFPAEAGRSHLLATIRYCNYLPTFLYNPTELGYLIKRTMPHIISISQMVIRALVLQKTLDEYWRTETEKLPQCGEPWTPSTEGQTVQSGY